MDNVQLLPMLARLNTEFGITNIHARVKEAERFAPGECLGSALSDLVGDSGAPVNQMFRRFVQLLPGGFQESMRSIIYYCLRSDPPVLINFAWAPAYDFELTIWEAVEPKPLVSGITMLLKTRYPDDAHPMRPQSAS